MFRYNPGRYDGTMILVPTADGFTTLDTEWNDSDATGRFYNAQPADWNGDGIDEIIQLHNDCDPSCADGAQSATLYVWNGIDDYTDAGPWFDAPCAVDETGTPIAPVVEASEEIRFPRGTSGTTVEGSVSANASVATPCGPVKARSWRHRSNPTRR